MQYGSDARSLIENAIGGSGNDTITGNAASNTLTGNAGNDTLKGAAGTDTLLGNGGTDYLYGGLGNDVLTGGAAADQFWIAYGDTSQDTITDFLNGTDKLKLTADITWAEISAAASNSGSNMVINLASHNNTSFIIQNFNTSQFDSTDVIW